MLLSAAWVVTAWGALQGVALQSPSLPVHLATFNIRKYPRSNVQVEGAFALLKSFGVSAIGLQEILRPEHLKAQARSRLGARWRYAAQRRGIRTGLGVLYDSDIWTMEGARSLRARYGPPPFEVRLSAAPLAKRGPTLRLVVVHLRSGASNHAIRSRQLQDLERALSGGVGPLMVMGDFNAVTPKDRSALREFARRTGLHWRSEGVECSCYWSRAKSCETAALDHVFSTDPGAVVRARGACETVGCHPGTRCPSFHSEVSDHCPLSITSDFNSFR